MLGECLLQSAGVGAGSGVQVGQFYVFHGAIPLFVAVASAAMIHRAVRVMGLVLHQRSYIEYPPCKMALVDLSTMFTGCILCLGAVYVGVRVQAAIFQWTGQNIYSSV
jgi:hypothetical protein